MAIQGFSKKEKVTSAVVINSLFSKNNFVLYVAPFRFSWIFIEPGHTNCQVLIVSSKRKLKRAVDRNKQKRQLRELYRINKQNLLTTLQELKVAIALSIVYVGAEQLDVNKHMPIFIKALQKIAIAVQKNHTISIPPAH